MENFREYITESKVQLIGVRKNELGTASIDMKLKGMRKAQEFDVYPIKTGDREVTIQSETRIGRLDLTTGKGYMSKSHPSGAYFVHLTMDKLEPFEFSSSDFSKVKKGIKGSSAKGSSGVIYFDNTGAKSIGENVSKFTGYIKAQDLHESEGTTIYVVTEGKNSEKVLKAFTSIVSAERYQYSLGEGFYIKETQLI
jgi:hypothetical protein